MDKQIRNSFYSAQNCHRHSALGKNQRICLFQIMKCHKITAIWFNSLPNDELEFHYALNLLVIIAQACGEDRFCVQVSVIKPFIIPLSLGYCCLCTALNIINANSCSLWAYIISNLLQLTCYKWKSKDKAEVGLMAFNLMHGLMYNHGSTCICRSYFFSFEAHSWRVTLHPIQSVWGAGPAVTYNGVSSLFTNPPCITATQSDLTEKWLYKNGYLP